jgi:hypothetical protein
MTYSISCVLLIPGDHQEAINALAYSLGYGPDNLGVKLVKAEGAIWYGCHTWCTQEFLNQLGDPAHASDATNALIFSAIQNGSPDINWSKSLQDNGLSTIEGFI